MYPNLAKIGVLHPERIETYRLKQEGDIDVLKIYFEKEKGEFLAKSIKLKYPRQRKRILSQDCGESAFKPIYEINPELRSIVDELDKISAQEHKEIDIKKKILSDLQHLERVVAQKVAEIEADIEKLK